MSNFGHFIEISLSVKERTLVLDIITLHFQSTGKLGNKRIIYRDLDTNHLVITRRLNNKAFFNFLQYSVLHYLQFGIRNMIL